jgi:hypothetical protein
MRYIDFRDRILEELRRCPDGLTWAELKQRLDLPYAHPCPAWVARLEQEVGLTRSRDSAPAYVWSVPR